MKVYIIYKEKNYMLYPNRKYRLGNTRECDIYIEEAIDEVLIQVKNDRLLINYNEYSHGIYTLKLIGLKLRLLILEKNKYFLLDRKNVLIDSTDLADIYFKEIKYPVLISYEEETKIVSEGDFYLNGYKTTGEVSLKEFDEIVFLEGLSIKVLGRSLSLFSNATIKSEMITYDEDERYENRAEEFHRSPRIILREPTDKVTVGTPPMEEEESRQSLLRLLMMPLAMVFFTILMYIYSSSGTMMIMMFGMSTVTIITSIHSYVSDRKKFKERQQKKVKDYKEYLEENWYIQPDAPYYKNAQFNLDGKRAPNPAPTTQALAPNQPTKDDVRDAPLSADGKKYCTAPWWEKVKSGQFVKAYRFRNGFSDIPCQVQLRLCVDGELEWTYQNPTCQPWETSYEDFLDGYMNQDQPSPRRLLRMLQTEFIPQPEYGNTLTQPVALEMKKVLNSDF